MLVGVVVVLVLICLTGHGLAAVRQETRRAGNRSPSQSQSSLPAIWMVPLQLTEAQEKRRPEEGLDDDGGWW
jgi:hypothetical protein